jgi:shikimate kinase
MGTGKTAVSKQLATQLKRQRLCIDDMIEWKVGKPIARIFEEDGEEFFRKVESDIAVAISKDKNVIIDAGGGVVINEVNVKRLKEHSVVICLTAQPEAILERTKGYRHRPLLNSENPLDSIQRLLAERQEYYKRADYTIDTSDISIEEVCDKVLKIMEEAEASKKHHLVFT